MFQSTNIKEKVAIEFLIMDSGKKFVTLNQKLENLKGTDLTPLAHTHKH